MGVSSKKPQDYDLRVFVNCPFDTEFKPLFDAIVFAIHDLGFRARHALIDDSKASRLDRIAEELGNCKYSLHDLSRIEVSKVGKEKLPRLNMAFEAGIAYGLHKLERKGREHHLGLLDSAPYRYQASISDLAGVDLKCHKNEPKEAIKCVREFLQRKSQQDLPGAAHVHKRFEVFEEMLTEQVNKGTVKLTMDELNSMGYVNDRQILAAAWIQQNPA